MAEYSAALPQTVEANQNVLFTEAPVPGCFNIMHRQGSGLVNIRGTKKCYTKYRVTFSGNIALPAGDLGSIALAIAVNGEQLNSTVMAFVPAALNDLGNVSSSAIIAVPCGCCFTISVKNINTQAITVSNPNLIVEKECC